MLPVETLQDTLLFLPRDDLDAVQLVSIMLNCVVAKMPGDSPVRHIAWLYLKNDSEGSLQVELVRNESDIGNESTFVESADISRFVRTAGISNVSFGTLHGPVDWAVLVDNLRCLKPLLSSACIHLAMLGVCFQLPPPGPLLQALFGDVLDTRTGLDFGCGEVDLGRGELLRLPSLRACTELFLSADAPVIDNVDDVENFVNWLHSPTDGLKVFAHTIVPLPTHPRRLNNLKVADDMWGTFRERCLERFENADRLLIFTATVVFPAAAELPLFASQGFRNTDTNEMLSFRVSDSMPGLTEQHVLVRRVPLME